MITPTIDEFFEELTDKRREIIWTKHDTSYILEVRYRESDDTYWALNYADSYSWGREVHEVYPHTITTVEYRATPAVLL